MGGGRVRTGQGARRSPRSQTPSPSSAAAPQLTPPHRGPRSFARHACPSPDTDISTPLSANPRSTGTFYQRGHDEVISRIEERVALATMVPVENQEGLQILHYVSGQKYGEGVGKFGACRAFREGHA